ncbi:MAG TPA: TatD family hydrolase [Polyangiaceae bacterium]|nr:TatD family hydrolase [Polyangiaceae bacterium]
MTWFDTHCHLDTHHTSKSGEGEDAILDRARSAGVSAFLCVGVGGMEQAEQAIAIAERHADVYASAGVHPHDAARDGSLDFSALWSHPRLLAVGEVGLDYHYDHSPRDTQAEVFRRYIALARDLQKPLIIHTRSAAEDTLQILEGEGARDAGGVIHCFSEDRAFAARALDLGFYLSFSGIVTFKTARAIQEVAAWAPADRILVETDSPYLAPVPLRGKPCEPAYVVHTGKYVAALRGVSDAHLASLTTENARRCFRVPLAPS